MYTPISQRENIEDEDIAKIADYLDRVAKKFESVNITQRHNLYSFYLDNYLMLFSDGNCTIRSIKGTDWVKDIIIIPTPMLAELIPGVYGILKHNK